MSRVTDVRSRLQSGGALKGQALGGNLLQGLGGGQGIGSGGLLASIRERATSRFPGLGGAPSAGGSPPPAPSTQNIKKQGVNIGTTGKKINPKYGLRVT